MDANIVIALIGLGGAVFGGIITIVGSHMLPKTKQVDVAAQIRDELREDALAYRNEVKALRSELATERKEANKKYDTLVKYYEDIYKKLRTISEKIADVAERQKLFEGVVHPDDL